MMIVVAIAAWSAVGALVGWIAARHGHWAKLWALTAMLGPLAVPLVVAAHRRGAEIRPRMLAPGRRRPGAVDVLVGVDGSEASMTAAVLAARLFGKQVGRITLATVLDYDTAAPHAESLFASEPWQEEVHADAVLSAAVQGILTAHTGLQPGAVLLAGDPAEALERYAVDHGYEVVVVGCRGRGASALLFGSCATRLSRHPQVPVLVISEAATGRSAAAEQLRLGSFEGAGAA